ncbi:MAG TPA: hypothetical protein EYQ64_06330 [Gemmatimonadetes bacterium]|nr:hypothetical protein [Gemmatimonadota bacterium]
MLLKQETPKGIQSGAITLAFRRWRRPTVKSGGTLLTAIGQLAIAAVDVVSVDEITEAESSAAGFSSLDALRSEFSKRTGGDVFRVRLSLAGPDPRIALRQEIPEDEEADMILGRLARLDSRGATGPWTSRVLTLLRDRPEVRAGDLPTDMGMDKTSFKVNARKLKGLGLTESLGVGYRLSPRGEAVLGRMQDEDNRRST